MEVALQFYRSKVAPFIVLSGGLDEPPHLQGAKTLLPVLLDQGIPEEDIVLDCTSRNTRQQAVNVVNLAAEHEWRTLVLVASPGHLYRAFLTFLTVLQETGQAETIRLVPVPASQLPWWGKPEGMEARRIDLLESEFQRIAEYRDHVATYEEGLEYLCRWEAR
jgi:uncharacterized SAM-binding protein YcdF (DUF218 family)